MNATLRTAAFATAAVALSLSTLAATLAPSTARAQPTATIVELPRVLVSGHRATATAIVDLPKVVVAGRRAVAVAIVDLPKVLVSARRTQMLAAADLR